MHPEEGMNDYLSFLFFSFRHFLWCGEWREMNQRVPSTCQAIKPSEKELTPSAGDKRIPKHRNDLTNEA
jgi:hypothetical protein